MRAGGREKPGSHEDARLSQLYQQLTELQAPRFGAGYDVDKGLERYRAWLGEQTRPGGPWAGARGHSCSRAARRALMPRAVWLLTAPRLMPIAVAISASDRSA